MQDILEKYGNLLSEVDNWFAICLRQYPENISCQQGCSACCRGLFDITLMDAVYLKSGFDQLPDVLKNFILSKSQARMDAISRAYPAFVHPWLLNSIPEADWDLVMPEDDEIPCVLLSESGQCLVYEYRPMTCRLNGIPMIDISGEELFDEWCSLNFVNVDPLLMAGLRFNFNELFAQELLLFRELSKRLIGRSINEIDTVIPAALSVDIESVVNHLTSQELLSSKLNV